MKSLWFAFLLVFFVPFAALAQQKDPPRRFSQCQAIAQAVPGAQYAAFEPAGTLPVLRAAMADQVVSIRYVGHSTFYIRTPEGIGIATDFNGWFGMPARPDVVTMNKAHSSHYTLSPDPAIAHVLHGWNDEAGKKAEHAITVGDAYIRNVTTDIRSYGGFEQNGNSIFIFEVAGLCIGHLGHLHHELDDGHFAEIGRLDVVMVPVDGGLTMGAISMSKVVTRLRSSLILPMHRRGTPIANFIAMFGEKFDFSISDSDSVDVSLKMLPKKPLILVLKGV